MTVAPLTRFGVGIVGSPNGRIGVELLIRAEEGDNAGAGIHTVLNVETARQLAELLTAAVARIDDEIGADPRNSGGLMP